MLFSVPCSNSEINLAISGAAAPYFSKAIHHVPTNTEVHLFLFLIKLYLANVVELIPSLKKHVPILGTKSFPWKAD